MKLDFFFIFRKLNEIRYKVHKNLFASLLLKSVAKLIYDIQYDLALFNFQFNESTDKNPDESVNELRKLFLNINLFLAKIHLFA